MHTYESNGYLFHYNSDMSGDVIIVNKDNEEELEVNGEAMLNFVANHIKNEKISRLENITTKEILEGVV